MSKAFDREDSSFDIFMNWLLVILLFIAGMSLFASGVETLLAGSSFGLVSLALGGSLSFFLLKKAIKYKRNGSLKKLDILKYSGIMITGIAAFILILSELVYPIVKKEDHAAIKNENYMIEIQFKTLYSVDALLFHHFFADIQDMSSKVDEAECKENIEKGLNTSYGQ